MENRDRNEMLERQAELILGADVLAGLKEWYNYSLKDKWDYVVYIVRRSYIVALIMEEITGWKMEEKEHACFLTDSSFLLSCEDFASHYRKYGTFPSILLCDDILIHGRNMNRVIRAIEERLIELLPDVDSDIVKASLTDAVNIHVYAKADVNARLWLNERYWFRFKFDCKMQQMSWRKMAGNLSTLIFRSGYANATYIYSRFISNDDFKKLDDSQYYKTIYQNTVQYSKIKFSTVGDSVKAICTVRLIEDKSKKGYCMIPFVFLPNLDENETNRILDKIFLAAEKSNYDELFIDKLRLLNSLNGKRSINEWITLLLSLVLVKEFEREYKIGDDSKDMEKVLTKLARNYRFTDLDETREYLRYCVKHPIYDSLREMEYELFSNSVYEREIVKLSKSSNISITPQIIRKKLDDYFYESGKREEQMAVHKYDNPIINSYTRGCGFVLRDILSGFDYEQAQIAIAYILQMMDAGVLSLSSFAPVNMTVEGFAQFIKPGEQSLLVKALRYIEYIPCLALIYEWCRQVETDFYEYFTQYIHSDCCDIEKSMLGELTDFVKDLESMNQTPGDWNANYMVKFDTAEDEARQVEITKLTQKRTRHVECYMLYNSTQRKTF